MSKFDKFILVLLAIEHLGFGIYGLYSPTSIADLVGYELKTEFSYSEIRANYAMFTVLGLMAFFAIFFKSLVRQTYIIYAVIFTSLILGRVLNYFLTEDLNNTIMIVTAAEIVVVLLCLIRLFFLRRRKEEETE